VESAFIKHTNHRSLDAATWCTTNTPRNIGTCGSSQWRGAQADPVPSDTGRRAGRHFSLGPFKLGPAIPGWMWPDVAGGRALTAAEECILTGRRASKRAMPVEIRTDNDPCWRR
jgi:hypothetical protein